MTKEMYKHILHTTKRSEVLDGIIRAAMYDIDIKPRRFLRTACRNERNYNEVKEEIKMKKELYDEFITLASEDELAGILRVAVFDPDIMPSEFSKLAARVDTIKEKCEEIGK